MRSAADPRIRNLTCAIAAALLMAVTVPALATVPDQPPSRAEVKAAVQEVGKDPDLSHERIEQKLRFRTQDDPARKADDDASPAWKWLEEFARWLSEAGRVLIWLAGAIVLALLLLRLWRWSRVRALAGRGAAVQLPSHVQNLDIRPASLPDAVGAAAAALWMRGEQRAALSLLYRAGLSRLVHAHGVPIRGASTEGECLTLAHDRLDENLAAFFARLVTAWQRAVYGARMPNADDALAMCRDFDHHFGLPAAPTDGSGA